MEGLTPREKEILAALRQGGSNAFIASQLKVSDSTVKFHLKNIFRKLGVKNRVQAVMRDE